MGKSCAIDLRVTGSNPAGQLLIYFRNVSQFLRLNLVPRSCIKAFVRKPRRCSPRPSAPLRKQKQRSCGRMQGCCINNIVQFNCSDYAKLGTVHVSVTG